MRIIGSVGQIGIKGASAFYTLVEMMTKMKTIKRNEAYELIEKLDDICRENIFGEETGSPIGLPTVFVGLNGIFKKAVYDDRGRKITVEVRMNPGYNYHPDITEAIELWLMSLDIEIVD